MPWPFPPLVFTVFKPATPNVVFVRARSNAQFLFYKMRQKAKAGNSLRRHNTVPNVCSMQRQQASNPGLLPSQSPLPKIQNKKGSVLTCLCITTVSLWLFQGMVVVGGRHGTVKGRGAKDSKAQKTCHSFIKRKTIKKHQHPTHKKQ